MHLFFYKQVALEWQIAKQLLVLNPLPLSNNKIYIQIIEKWSSSFVTNLIYLAVMLNQLCSKVQLSEKHYGHNPLTVWFASVLP